MKVWNSLLAVLALALLGNRASAEDLQAAATNNFIKASDPGQTPLFLYATSESSGGSFDFGSGLFSNEEAVDIYIKAIESILDAAKTLPYPGETIDPLIGSLSTGLKEAILGYITGTVFKSALEIALHAAAIGQLINALSDLVSGYKVEGSNLLLDPRSVIDSFLYWYLVLLHGKMIATTRDFGYPLHAAGSGPRRAVWRATSGENSVLSFAREGTHGVLFAHRIGF